MFYLGKIPVKINPLFWVLALAIGWINSFTIVGTLICAVVILISVMFHELGHAITAMFFNQKVKIELSGLGGLTTRRGPPIKFWQEFLIVLNGPLAGFLLCYIAYVIYSAGLALNPMLIYALKVAIFVNLFWTIVNLFPVHPLDGGQLMRIVLEASLGVRGLKIAFFLSMIVSGLVSAAAFVYQEVFIGAIFSLFAFENYRAWKSSLSVTDFDRNQDTQKLLKDAEQQMRRGNTEAAFQQFQAVRNLAKSGVTYLAATEYMAKLLNEEGKYQEAYSLLMPISKKLNPESLRLLQQLTYKIGNWEEAIALGNRAYQYTPGYDIALINSLAHSILGHDLPAIGWLKTAINDGLPNIEQVLKKKEFDHIRGNPEFINITSR